MIGVAPEDLLAITVDMTKIKATVKVPPEKLRVTFTPLGAKSTTMCGRVTISVF